MKDSNTTMGGTGPTFPETRQDLLACLQGSDEASSRTALGVLARHYWKAVYLYVRVSWATTNEDGKDLTQGFFAWLLERGALRAFDPTRGTFRTYLKVMLRSFVSHQRAAGQRLKRGGGAAVVSLDQNLPVFEELVPDPTTANPEDVFDRQWVSDLVERSLERVRERCRNEGRETAFQVYDAYVLSADGRRPTYADLAGRFGLKERTVESYLEALRLEVRREIRAELARMTASDRELEEEWSG